MATSYDLVERLYRRFKGVPNFTMADAQELVDEALDYHGFEPSADVPNAKATLVILYAQIQGAWQVAFSVAHYFKFTDGEESVDKSMVADNYRKLARDLQTEYDKEVATQHGTAYRVMRRIDRPHTSPPSGESGRYSWRKY
ncbi:hypothetical protein [Sporosarcina sp. ITBMC105]